MKELTFTGNSSESFYHKAIKHLIYEDFYDKTNIIAVREMEKYLGNRFADVYFQLKSGEQIVVEIQNSKITVQELRQRTQDYNHLGIYVLWLIHGEGNCVISKKYPIDAREQKISLAEKFLHQMYGGRVYYVNLDINHEKVELQRPFALHFSKVIKKSKRGMFESRYDKYFYRDVNCSYVPSWNLFCTTFAGFKIARFFDKNIKYALKQQIEQHISNHNLNSITKKTHLKSIVKQFNAKYGDFLILTILIELVNDNKLNLKYNLLRKIEKKIIFK